MYLRQFVAVSIVMFNIAMKIGRILVLCCFLFQLAQAYSIIEHNSFLTLKNSTLHAEISRSTGNVTSIYVFGRKINTSECSIRLYRDSSIWNGSVESIQTRQYKNYAEVIIQKTSQNSTVIYSFRINDISLDWGIAIMNSSDNSVAIAIEFHMPVVNAMSHVFKPCEDPVRSLTDTKLTSSIYRRDISLPLICLYNNKKNHGLTVVADFEHKKPHLAIMVDNKDIVYTYTDLRATPEHPLHVSHHLIGHEGDWRPGLKKIMNIYPENFNPKVPVDIHNIWYFLSNPFVREKKIRELQQDKTGWVEMHGYFPFYGHYAPKAKSWNIISNSDKITLDEWERSSGQDNSYHIMNKVIELYHTYGIKVYLYFQVFEAWHQWAETYYTSSIAFKASGNPYPAWQLTNLMNPDPSYVWGNYIISQITHILDQYPGADGIFYDRMDYYNYDYAHDDGITYIDDRPAYMLAFAQEEINKTIFDLCHTKGKSILGNGPTSIEICKNLDGILAESDPTTLQRLQYLALTRPLVFLVKDYTPEQTEMKLKWALCCGAFPSITCGDSISQGIETLYQPLFNLYKARKWVLDKEPLKIPQHLMGNIYTLENGDYVIPIIHPTHSQLSLFPLEHNIPVEINVSDASRITHIYQLSGDRAGVTSLSFEMKGSHITTDIPSHLASSLLYLSQKSVYPVVQLSPPILLRGQTNEIKFYFADVPLDQTHITIKTPWSKTDDTLFTNSLSLTLPIPPCGDSLIAVDIYFNGHSYTFTHWIVDPVSIWAESPLFIQSSKGLETNCSITNNCAYKITVYLKGHYSPGGGDVQLPNMITLDPYETIYCDMIIQSHTHGNVNITAYNNDFTLTESFPVRVTTALKGNALFHDNFSNGMSQWTIKKGTWNTSYNTARARGTAHLAIKDAPEWENYIYEVTTQCMGSESALINWLKSYLYFRVQDERNFYRYGIHGDAGKIDLYKRLSGQWIKLGDYPFKPQHKQWYTLSVHLTGNNITCYLNGKETIRIQDNTFLSGGIGIGVLEDNMVCEYRDIVVVKL